MLEKLESDLKSYVAQIKALNKELESLDERRNEIVKVGFRLEGIVSYLRSTIAAAKLEGHVGPSSPLESENKSDKPAT